MVFDTDTVLGRARPDNPFPPLPFPPPSRVVHQQDPFGLNALHYASSKGHAPVVALLLDHGAKIEQTTPFGTALQVKKQRERESEEGGNDPLPS